MNQIHSPFKGKSKQQSSHKLVENEGSQKNRSKPRRGTTTMAMAATTVQPWWPLDGLPSFVPHTTCFAFCFDLRVACLGLFALGFLGLFASSLA